jgi:hypothetical protein
MDALLKIFVTYGGWGLLLIVVLYLLLKSEVSIRYPRPKR